MLQSTWLKIIFHFFKSFLGFHSCVYQINSLSHSFYDSLSPTIIFLWAYNVHNNCLVRGDLDDMPLSITLRLWEILGLFAPIFVCQLFIFFLRIQFKHYLMTDNTGQLSRCALTLHARWQPHYTNFTFSILFVMSLSAL